MNDQKAKWFEYRFVESVPMNLEKGVLYISIRFRTSLHLCACGCGEKVVTPISPEGWALTYNGQAISLFPSIGNWSFECQSHYWIKHNKVVWSRQWTEEEIKWSRRSNGALEKLLSLFKKKG